MSRVGWDVSEHVGCCSAECRVDWLAQRAETDDSSVRHCVLAIFLLRSEPANHLNSFFNHQSWARCVFIWEKNDWEVQSIKTPLNPLVFFKRSMYCSCWGEAVCRDSSGVAAGSEQLLRHQWELSSAVRAVSSRHPWVHCSLLLWQAWVRSLGPQAERTRGALC